MVEVANSRAAFCRLIKKMASYANLCNATCLVLLQNEHMLGLFRTASLPQILPPANIHQTTEGKAGAPSAGNWHIGDIFVGLVNRTNSVASFAIISPVAQVSKI